MGLLSEGEPIDWQDMKSLQQHVRQYGVEQFIRHYNKLKDDSRRGLKWGDEVEYSIVKLDHKAKVARVSLRAEELLEQLGRPEEEMLRQVDSEGRSDIKLASLWRPEYASYMVESTPGVPYESFNTVEQNMRNRRQEVEQLLEKDEICVTTSFPRLGCPGFTSPEFSPDPVNSFTRSLFWPSEATYGGHPRFAKLSENVRLRRGEKVAINVPIFWDEKTPKPFVEDLSALGDDGSSAVAAQPDHVYMDAMGFGMGLCCLQVTFQAESVGEAREVYDQLAPLCPIMLALTAATPAHRGLLVDTDCRWDIIAASVDDRTRGERGLRPLQEPEKFLIPKSRYDSIDCFISNCCKKWNGFNDIPVSYDQDIYDKLLGGGVDPLMAQHVAHLFIRDSISLFENKIKKDGQYEDGDLDHFENIQSTNWRTMRFKLPPPGEEDKIGWRVEFRPCELQISDFENAAVSCFVILLTRSIVSCKWNLLMPISFVDENMRRAQRRDAVLTEKFWWRKNICTACEDTCEPDLVEMTIDEIFNGIPGTDYQGLITLVRDYLRGQDDIEADTKTILGNYWHLLSQRASGKLSTNAHWMRQFFLSHPAYSKDSRVSAEMVYDLMIAIDEISRGDRVEPSLFVKVV